MNIKKEIKLFEKHAQKFFTTSEAFEKDGENYIYDEVKFMWDCWITAKHQAAPKGFVVAPVEPTERMLDCAYSSISDNLHYADLENIYRAMIQEAQR